MARIYSSTFFKFLNRNKAYTAISIIGLAISLMFVILISVYIYQELSVDKFHKDADRICLQFQGMPEEGGMYYSPMDALPVAYWLKERYPDIEAVCPVVGQQAKGTPVHYADRVANADFFFTESNFFTFFSFPLIEGDPESVLQDAYSAVVSESFARKLFGRTNVIGDSLRMGRESETVLRIAAVTEPVRSDEYDEEQLAMAFMKFDYAERAVEHKWAEKNFAQLQITFRVRPEADAPDFAERFEQEMKRQLQAGNLWVSGINSYAKIRADYLAHSDETTIRKLYTALGTFFLVNVFLAVIGTFWFRVNRRMGEIGLRMAMGSSRSGVRRLMTGEGLMLLTLATVPALLVCLNLAVAEVFSANVMPMTAGRFWAVSGVTYLSLALIIVLAIWYPSRKASRLEPADALHYE